MDLKRLQIIQTIFLGVKHTIAEAIFRGMNTRFTILVFFAKKLLPYEYSCYIELETSFMKTKYSKYRDRTFVVIVPVNWNTRTCVQIFGGN